MHKHKIPRCLTCQNFAWWDGEYCCISKMKIFTVFRKKWMFDDELMKTIKKEGHNCVDYVKSFNHMINQMHIEEYLNWKELHDLEKQLEMHVK